MCKEVLETPGSSRQMEDMFKGSNTGGGEEKQRVTEEEDVVEEATQRVRKQHGAKVWEGEATGKREGGSMWGKG